MRFEQRLQVRKGRERAVSRFEQVVQVGTVDSIALGERGLYLIGGGDGGMGVRYWLSCMYDETVYAGGCCLSGWTVGGCASVGRVEYCDILVTDIVCPC